MNLYKNCFSFNKVSPDRKLKNYLYQKKLSEQIIIYHDKAENDAVYAYEDFAEKIANKEETFVIFESEVVQYSFENDEKEDHRDIRMNIVYPRSMTGSYDIDVFKSSLSSNKQKEILCALMLSRGSQNFAFVTPFEESVIRTLGVGRDVTSEFIHWKQNPKNKIVNRSVLQRKILAITVLGLLLFVGVEFIQEFFFTKVMAAKRQEYFAKEIQVQDLTKEAKKAQEDLATYKASFSSERRVCE